MLTEIILVALSLAIILLSCELFTNSIEWLGARLKMGDGIVGSIISAVGTCLPETSIPVIAILFSGRLSKSAEISIGAIVGAPFMLGTLAFFVVGISVLLSSKTRKTGLRLNMDIKIIRRDLTFFLISYITGISMTLLEPGSPRNTAAVFLCGLYAVYILATVKYDIHTSGRVKGLYIRKVPIIRNNRIALPLQALLAFSGIIFGAELFVGATANISKMLGISALLLSMIVTPVATELPEKFNSILWVRRNKDTLALGNITGAMVFQSCIPFSIGITATSWQLDYCVAVSALLVILSAALVLLWLRVQRSLSPVPLLLGGLFYGAFIMALLIQSMP